MGDLNFDLTKNKRFLLVPYTLAAVGAVAGIAMAGAATLPAIAAAGVIGAVAGGIGVPVAATALLGGVAGLLGLAKGKGVAANEVAVIPLGMAFVGFSCAKAMFVTPFQAAFKGLKSVFNRKAAPSAAPQPKAKVKPSVPKKGI